MLNSQFSCIFIPLLSLCWFMQEAIHISKIQASNCRNQTKLIGCTVCLILYITWIIISLTNARESLLKMYHFIDNKISHTDIEVHTCTHYNIPRDSKLNIVCITIISTVKSLTLFYHTPLQFGLFPVYYEAHIHYVSEISGRLKHPFFGHPSIDTHLESLCSKFPLVMILCWRDMYNNMNILLHWILYCHFYVRT